MKTIEDAVIETNGKWQSGVGRFLKTKGPANIYKCRGSDFDFCCNNDNTNEYWIYLCSREEFEACAKRMGYINGYKYMEECTKKGKPNLPDDIMVSVMTYGRGRLPAGHVGFWNWDSSEIKSFRIVDERYKPADTSYLNIKPQDHIVEANEMVSDWWDYENDKALNCPPVGAEVEIIEDCCAPLSEFGQTFLGQKCVVMSSFKNKHSFDIISVEKPDGECCCFVLRLIRPLDHATRKAELERKELIQRAKDALPDDAPMIGNWNTIIWVIERLVDTGVIRK